jgi:hypothetical protein
MPKDHVVANSFNNHEANHCVDIVKQTDGCFRFQHWRREPEDLSGWILLLDSTPVTFKTEQETINAAKQAIVWFGQ